MNLAQIASVGVCANTLIDRHVMAPFNFEDVYDAVEDGKFLELLSPLDDSGLLAWAANLQEREHAELLFREAALALEGHEMAKAGVGVNPLCLIIALVFQAMRYVR